MGRVESRPIYNVKVFKRLIMFCPNCGNQVEEGTKFCANCGEKIGSEVNTPAELVVSKNPDPFAEKCFINENPVEYVVEYSTKTKTVAGLLAFFFGGFGVMDFYVGKSGNGIVKLILTFTGICALVTLLWNIYDMFGIAKEKYCDENGLPLAGDPAVVIVLAILQIGLLILCAIAMPLIIECCGIVFAVLLDLLHIKY